MYAVQKWWQQAFAELGIDWRLAAIQQAFIQEE
jgi:hypothetical protein